MTSHDLNDDSEGNRDDTISNSIADARRAGGRVGVALIVVAVLGVVTNVGFAVVANAIQRAGPQPQPPPNMTQDEKVNWERGRDAAPAMQLCVAVFVSLVYLPVFLGGLKLQKGQGRGLATIAAVMAMLPCSAAFLVGLPIGIWALMVLGRPEVKEALEPPTRPRRRTRQDDDWEDPPRRRQRDED